MPIDDSRRLLALTADPRAGALSPIAFHAEERISAPYEISVTALSEQPAIDPDTLLFTPASLRVQNAGGERYFHGMVRSLTREGASWRGYYTYTLLLVPRFWFKGQTADCRIFQDMSLSDIITALATEVQQEVTMRIFGAKPVLPYVTQYNETDLHFLSRHMEEAGLFYFFEHEETKHTLIVTDQNQGFPAQPSPKLVVAYDGDGSDTLTEWRAQAVTTHGSVTLFDYDPVEASNLQGSAPTKLKAAGTDARDVIAFPARTDQGQTAQDRSTIAMEAAEAEALLFRSRGAQPALIAGGRFTLEKDPNTQASEVVYVVQAITHDGRDESWAGRGGETHYGNQFTAFPASVTWRQVPVLRRPAMAGIFAATVIGGDDISSERYGRVKVRLMWDYAKKTTAGSAVWVRVLQPWAGNGWGWQHLPRVGTEVGVAFMNGDPDQPVVVGGFYNGKMALPFAVPGDQNKSGLRTRSTPNGGSANYSELSFDDSKGAEKILLHAERDMVREVEHDDTVTIGNQQTITVAQGRKLTVQSGDYTVQVQGGAISVQATNSITLTVGDSSVKIDQTGVTISGMLIKVQGETMVQIKADGMLQAKGGIVMIN